MASVGTTRRSNVVGLSDELADLIVRISEAYERENRSQREEMISLWLKLENYFNGLQRRYWNLVATDWRRLPDDEKDESARHYDKIINIYRAHAEAIIAALSIKTPSAIFYPEDADVQEDVTTAKACVKIKELIERHNEAKLLIIKAICILFNQGVVAAYIYNRKHDSYGTFQRARYSDKTIKLKTVLLNCAECGSNLDEAVFKGDEKAKINEEEKKCPVCGFEGVPVQDEHEEEVPELLGYSNEAKSRTRIELFSPLFVHMPFYARNQELMPYIRMKFEQHFSLLKGMYPKLHKKIGIDNRMDAADAENRSIYVEHSNNLVTTQCLWVRPWGYDVVDGPEDAEKIKKLREKFPDGFYAVLLGDELAEVHNEDLDDHWAISENPLSTYIHAEPIGKPLAPIQDLQNEVVDLQIETFEHAIPETFVYSDVIDFKAYGKSRAQPGMIYPAKPQPDRNLNESFHSLKTATLSEESQLFLQNLKEQGQFVVGSFPSIFGGPATSGSKTAKEYVESRSMALQRQSINWNIIKFWWAKTSAKAVMQFIRAMRQEEQDYKDVERTTTGFKNVWIRQVDLEGKIGRVEADAEEDLPLSPHQLKQLIVELMSLKDEGVTMALQHPQNTKFIAKALGAPDFFIPGQDSREKQYAEINQILNGEPVEVKEWEDHPVEAEILVTFMISEVGRMVRKENPEGFAMLEEHLAAHKQAEIAKQAAQQQPAPGAVNPETGAQ